MDCARENCRSGRALVVPCGSCGHVIYCCVECRDRDKRFPSAFYCNRIPADGEYVTGGVNNAEPDPRLPTGVFHEALAELRKKQILYGGLADLGLGIVGAVALPVALSFALPVALSFGASAAAVTGGLAAAGGGPVALGGAGMAGGIAVGATAATAGGAMTAGGAISALGLDFAKTVRETVAARRGAQYYDTIRIHPGTKTRLVYDGQFRRLEYHGGGSLHPIGDGPPRPARFDDGVEI